MKEYNRYTNDIHAPKELVEKTKAAVRKEEAGIKEKDGKAVAYIRGIAAAAAVIAAVVISIPIIRDAGIFSSNEAGGGFDTTEQTGGDILLSQEEQEPVKIERKQTVIEEGSAVGEALGQEKIDSRKIKGIKVSVYEDGEKGFLAEFVIHEISYRAANKEESMEQFLMDIEEFIGGFE